MLENEAFTDEDQVVAYSNKRKNLKNTSKSVAKKGNTSPKNSAFFNNSTIGDMSNVWQKYRRNMHEAKQKTNGRLRSSSLAHKPLPVFRAWKKSLLQRGL